MTSKKKGPSHPKDKKYLGKYEDPRRVPTPRDREHYQNIGWDKADDGHPREQDPIKKQKRKAEWLKRRGVLA